MYFFLALTGRKRNLSSFVFPARNRGPFEGTSSWKTGCLVGEHSGNANALRRHVATAGEAGHLKSKYCGKARGRVTFNSVFFTFLGIVYFNCKKIYRT